MVYEQIFVFMVVFSPLFELFTSALPKVLWMHTDINRCSRAGCLNLPGSDVSLQDKEGSLSVDIRFPLRDTQTLLFYTINTYW